MSSVRLGVQTAIVLALVVFVGRPDYHRATSAEAAAARANASRSDSGTQAPQNGPTRGASEIGYGSISARRATDPSATPLQRAVYEEGVAARRHQTALSLLTLGARANGIIGQVRTTLNAPVPFARLVLRDPLTGRVEARAIADDKGNFTFVDILPGGYVVELLGPKDAVFATSEVVTVALGELREAFVRLGDTREVLGTIGTLESTAAESIAAAAQSGITAIAAPDRSVSPQR